MPKPSTCLIKACGKPIKIKSRGWCQMHYFRWRRHGDPELLNHRSGPDEDLTGRRFGKLLVLGYVSRGRWDAACNCGRATVVRTGDLNRGTAQTCGDKAEHYRIVDPGYNGVHVRLRADIGPAAAHQCVDCGTQAHHWSYDHQDPCERVRAEDGLPYSLDPSHYEPRCVPCHKAFDLNRLAGTTSRHW
jgi:hypothetical protein